MSSGRQRLNELSNKIDEWRAIKDINVPTDGVKFFQEVLDIEPYPHQKTFLWDPEPLKVIRWCRRAGKTLVMSGADIKFASTHSGTTTIVTMPKYNQIKEIYFQSESGIHAHLARMPRDYYGTLIKEELQTIIRFKNGSKIIPETPEPFTIRGHSPGRINIDEFNFIRKDRDLWLSALLPMTLTKIVYITISSTPWNEDSVYHQMCFSKDFDMFSGNKYHKDGAKYLKTWKDLLKPNGPLDMKQVAIMRKQYKGDPWRWRREMECAFVSDETAWLPSSLIVKCQNSDLNFYLFEDVPRESTYFIGWDLGREKDPGSIAVVDAFADVRRLVHCKSFKLKTPYTTQMGYLKSICDRWPYVKSVAYDKTGTKGVDEQIDRAGFPRVEPVTFTTASKHGMAVGLKDLMMTVRQADRTKIPDLQQRQFELPYDQDVFAELNVVQWEQPPGSELYRFSHPENSHDDKFWAIAMACFAARRHRPSQMEIETGRVPR